MSELSGQCLCGDVKFTIQGPFKELTQCHCGQCRQWSGNPWTSLNFELKDFAYTSGENKVHWFQSSQLARRGSCKSCGSALFYHANGEEKWAHIMAVSAGSLNAPTNLSFSKHIFCADKGDYYKITDGYPQIDKY